MASPALTVAVDRIRTVFAGLTSPDETGCTYCYGEDDIALLRTPDVALPEDLLRMFAHEVPDHFTDHSAVIRRLLPQFTADLAAGRIEGLGYSSIGLSRARWHTWPRRQTDAISEFLDAWWLDTILADDPVYPATVVFAACAEMAGTVTPLLARWAEQPVGGRADAHLADVVDSWIDDLLNDCDGATPWWYWFDRDEPLAEIQAWVLEYAPDRLSAQGADADLLFKIGLLALPYEDRWSCLP
jgi:hypothetical protein